ncbi:hypothetical protein TanjilG_10701 [Lupinus angustifolius]|nr:hypothetical protein TanjilG_10701 [Lupinus angustifolius]
MHQVLGFYTNLVGSTTKVRKGVNLVALRKGKCLNRDLANTFVHNVNEREVLDALNDIGDNKAPGVDGYTSHFFKAAWNVIRVEVLEVVKKFFNKQSLYPTVNCTLITLIPKSNDACTMKDMRPISCCTTFYKIISKILTKRLNKVID